MIVGKNNFESLVKIPCPISFQKEEAFKIAAMSLDKKFIKILSLSMFFVKKSSARPYYRGISLEKSRVYLCVNI